MEELQELKKKRRKERKERRTERREVRGNGDVSKGKRREEEEKSCTSVNGEYCSAE